MTTIDTVIDNDIDEMQWVIEGKTPCCGGTYIKGWQKTSPVYGQEQVTHLIEVVFCSKCKTEMHKTGAYYYKSR